MKKCKFCSIKKRERIIFETKHFVFVKSKFPIIKLHCLLISKMHIREERNILEEHWEDYRIACSKAYKYMKKRTNLAPLTFINPPQMQSIKHFHRQYLSGIFGVHGVANALKNCLKSITC